MRVLQNVLLVIGSTALGTSLGYFGLIHQAMGWWGTAVVTAACGTVGGIVSGIGVGSWNGRKRR